MEVGLVNGVDGLNVQGLLVGCVHYGWNFKFRRDLNDWEVYMDVYVENIILTFLSMNIRYACYIG